MGKRGMPSHVKGRYMTHSSDLEASLPENPMRSLRVWRNRQPTSANCARIDGRSTPSRSPPRLTRHVRTEPHGCGRAPNRATLGKDRRERDEFRRLYHR
jgi:hypothetical protein